MVPVPLFFKGVLNFEAIPSLSIHRTALEWELDDLSFHGSRPSLVFLVRTWFGSRCRGTGSCQGLCPQWRFRAPGTRIPCRVFGIFGSQCSCFLLSLDFKGFGKLTSLRGSAIAPLGPNRG